MTAENVEPAIGLDVSCVSVQPGGGAGRDKGGGVCAGTVIGGHEWVRHRNESYSDRG